MDNRDKIHELIAKHNDALNKISHPELDSLLKVPFEDCPYFSDYYEKRNCEKEWFTIDSDYFFNQFVENLVNYDPLFNKTSNLFKKRLKQTILFLFNEENKGESFLTKPVSKKYPSWARLWNEFCLKSLIHGEFPWEDKNDQIVYLKYNTYEKDMEIANQFLGFNFKKEYRKLKKLYSNPLLDLQIQKQKNSINKKVS